MFSKSLFTSKTFWVNLLTGIVTVAGEYSGIIPPAWAPYIAAAVGVANIVLRLLTNTPVHVTTPSVVSQVSAVSPVVTKQAGFMRLGLLLTVGAGSLLWLGACATTGTSTPASIAFDAQTAADQAVKAIPALLQSKAISASTAKAIVQAADDVNAAAGVVEGCTRTSTTPSTCSTAAVTAALSALSQLTPK